MKHSLKTLVCAALLGSVALSVPAHAEYISYRHHDADIMSAQMRLKQLGYFVGKTDGIKGPRTTNALAAFQRNNGLMVTGNYDYYTQSALFPMVNTYYNNPYVRSYGYVQQGYVPAYSVAYAVPLNDYRAGATYAQPIAYAAQLPQPAPVAQTYAISEAMRYGNVNASGAWPVTTTVVPRPW